MREENLSVVVKKFKYNIHSQNRKKLYAYDQFVV